MEVVKLHPLVLIPTRIKVQQAVAAACLGNLGADIRSDYAATRFG